MKKLSIREIIDILIKVDGIGYQKLHLIDASNGYHHEIGIRYDLPGDEHPYSTTKWKHINGVWVPRYVECFIPEPTQIRGMEKYAIPGNNLFLLPERVVNEIIHQYRLEFWPDTINRMKIRNIYHELWDIPTYIHYGSTQFDPKKKFPIRNDSWTKPRGGFWASRVDATFGWKDWCKREDFRDCDPKISFKFTLSHEAVVARVSNLDDLNMLPELPNDTFLSHVRLSYDIDFEKCLKMGIDAIELCWYGEEWSHKAKDDMYFNLYGWDCDSMVILNPDIVIRVK